MGAKLPDLETVYKMGIDPKTGLPLKMSNPKYTVKGDIKKTLRIADEQDAVNRYVWYNLPCNITSQELEKWLYYRGQLCFFYDDKLDQFYFASYALDGTIDPYGRYNHIHPLPLTGGTDGEGKKRKGIEAYWSDKRLKCVYGMILDEEVDYDTMIGSAVLLHDYTKQLGEQIIPRANLNDPLLDVMAECIPFMRTSLLASTGVKGVRVNDADQADSVKDGNRGLEHGALTGEPLVPIIGNIEFQELTNGATAKSEEYMLAMQSLDNFRLSLYGIDNGGLFEKKAHELQSEADINGGPVGLVLQDGLSIRQNFCNIVNSIWGIGMWCEPAQNVMGVDNDGDGSIHEDNSDGANTGTQANNEGGAADGE